MNCSPHSAQTNLHRCSAYQRPSSQMATTNGLPGTPWTPLTHSPTDKGAVQKRPPSTNCWPSTTFLLRHRPGGDASLSSLLGQETRFRSHSFDPINCSPSTPGESGERNFTKTTDTWSKEDVRQPLTVTDVLGECELLPLIALISTSIRGLCLDGQGSTGGKGLDRRCWKYKSRPSQRENELRKAP